MKNSSILPFPLPHPLLPTLAASALLLCACGGGGGDSDPGASAAPASTPPAVVTAPAPEPVSSSTAATSAGTPTLAADAYPGVSAADCPNLQAPSVSAPTILGSDMQSVSDILSAADPIHGYAEFSRLPASFLWWVRSAGSSVDESTLGVAMHETNHVIDFALRAVCHTDNMARFFADSQIHVTDLVVGSTAPFNIVAETYPGSLKLYRAARYEVYIAGAEGSQDDLDGVLEELNAYTGGAQFEAGLLSGAYASVAQGGDLNAGGTVDAMSYLLCYLQAARLNHPATYALIRSQPATIAFLQFAWSRAEAMLVAMYPYSTAAGGTQIIPVDALAVIYSPAFISELDRLGIAHRTAADWKASYLA
jgi:hypothetical protein